MKKVMIILLLIVATSTASFAKSSDYQAKTAVKEVVKNAPAGTTYGVVEATDDYIVVNTPLGRHTIYKNEDGSFSFMGITAKLVSAKNGVYKIKTSVGTFCVNTHKANITKQ